MRLALTSAASLLVVALFPGPASAFVGKPRLAPTPPRFVSGHADAAPAKLRLAGPLSGLFGLGSRRANGAPVTLWRRDDEAPRSLEESAIAVEAMNAARALHAELQLGEEDALELSSVRPLDHEWATATLAQRFRGVLVRDGVVIFAFHAGRLSVVHNYSFAKLDVSTEPRLAANAALEVAMALVRSDAPTSERIGDPELRIWVPSDDARDARLAWAVSARSMTPRTERVVFVDAQTNELLAVDDEVRAARVRLQVETTQDGPTSPVTLPFLTVGSGQTDGDGLLAGSGGEASYTGARARVVDASGAALERFQIPAQGIDLTPNNLSQADPFAHVLAVKSFSSSYAPRLAWLDQRLDVRVNIADECNAFWDGSSVSFFAAGPNCRNSGRIASVVYHEFGHGLHAALTSRMDGALSEGAGDFWSCSFRGDARMGVGFVGNGAAIRRLDRSRIYPRDFINEVHEDGLIFATALWELRSALMAKHGDWNGVRITNRIFLRALSQGPDLSTAYPAMIAGDDDDANADNGTPNACEINQIFRAHGLVDGGSFSHREATGRAFAKISHTPPGRFTSEVVIEASVENGSTCGTLDPSDLLVVYAKEGQTEERVPVTNGRATLAGIEPGDSFHYHLELEADGAVFTHGSPSNPHRGVRARVGEVELLREGFENMSDLTTGADAGAGDWQAAVPGGLLFDPSAAKEGTKVLGTDLGQGAVYGSSDGIAKAGRTWAELPPFVVDGHEAVRLELFEHWAMSGTRRILVNGAPVFSETSDGTSWSGGFVLRVIEVPSSEGQPVTIRFESEIDSGNVLGGWSIDDLRITALQIPKPIVSETPDPEANGNQLGGNTDVSGAEPLDGIGPTDQAFQSRVAISGGCACTAPASPRSLVNVALIFGLAVRRRLRRT
ncbi:MAG: M36 family metallopeptidase [Deltaproteobacteria bacterium]|nr:M36 family metallopeptidase [Deltaproteobacteria bacterium]